MANGKKFDPDQLTAASWFYPLGSKVRVTLRAPGNQSKAVIVRITDRGPSMDLVREGRIIDLTYAAFQRLSSPERGLIEVKVERVQRSSQKPRS
jgi:rare lipoprotein A